MREPAELIEFLSDPALGGHPVLIEALDGFSDAGHGVRLAREHLSESFESETVARFEVDELLDFRSRRPLLLFDTDRWEDYEAPMLSVERHRDADGTPFLVLAGPEPDTQWDRFIAAVFLVVERAAVRLTVGLHSVPWAVAHTRPIAITAHGRPAELLTPPPFGPARVHVPGSVGHLLEYRLGAAGRAAIGFAAHTPYYLSNLEYPAAAVSLLESVEQAAGLQLSLAPLRARALEVQAAIDAQTAADEQVQAIVQALEERDETAPGSAPAADDIPTGDELGAAFERFLAEQEPGAGSDDSPS